MKDLVSVIIPTYNHRRFLAEAIESALGQTHPRVEVVVVDDGSTDDSATLVARYPVKYFRQDNAGLAAARNAGIRESHGDFLTFLDADDRLMPEAAAIGVSHLQRHPDWAFVSGEHRYIAENGAVLQEWSGPRPSSDHYAQLLRKNYIGDLATVVFRRSVLQLTGGFRTSLRACEDYDLYLRIARRFPVGAHETLVAEYRRYGTAMSDNLCLMLASSVGVLRAQRRHVHGHPSLVAAYRDGIAFWSSYYGRPLVTQTIESLRRPGRRIEGLRSFLHLIRFAPRRVRDVLTSSRNDSPRSTPSGTNG